MKGFFKFSVFCVLSFMFLVCFVPVVFSAYPLSTDDAGVLGQTGSELEFCYDNTKIEDAPRTQVFDFSFKHGLTNKMDVGIFFPILIDPKPEESFGMATLGLKFQVVKDVLAFSLTNTLGLTEYFLNGVLSKEISPATLHLNLGYQATGVENIKGSINYSSAIEYPVKKSDFVFEILGDEEGLQGYLLGLRYNVNDNFSLAFAYGNGFDKTNERITFGFHYGF